MTHFHTHSRCTLRMGLSSQKHLSSVCHESSCAALRIDHPYEISFTDVSHVLIFLDSQTRLVIHDSIYHWKRSTAGWQFHRTPLFHRLEKLTYNQSLIHSTYDSAESIATHPDSDLEDEQLQMMLASPLYTKSISET